MNRANLFQNYIDLMQEHSRTKCLCQGDDGYGERIDIEDIPEPCEIGKQIDAAFDAYQKAPKSGGSLSEPPK